MGKHDKHHGASSAALRWPPSSRRPAGELTVRQVDPAAWQTALELAGRDPRRLVILGPSTVLVLNSRRR